MKEGQNVKGEKEDRHRNIIKKKCNEEREGHERKGRVMSERITIPRGRREECQKFKKKRKREK